MDQRDRQTLSYRMRTPLLTFAVLLGLLGGIVTSATTPFAHAGMACAALCAAMVATVMVVSMELWREPPIIRFFAAIGFCWVAILFMVTSLDYLTRGPLAP